MNGEVGLPPASSTWMALKAPGCRPGFELPTHGLPSLKPYFWVARWQPSLRSLLPVCPAGIVPSKAVGQSWSRGVSCPPPPRPPSPPTLTRLTASWACTILMFLDGFRSESSWVDPR